MVSLLSDDSMREMSDADGLGAWGKSHCVMSFAQVYSVCGTSWIVGAVQKLSTIQSEPSVEPSSRFVFSSISGFSFLKKNSSIFSLWNNSTKYLHVSCRHLLHVATFGWNTLQHKPCSGFMLASKCAEYYSWRQW